MQDQLQARTIQDFGEQWTRFRENRGYYASVALLEDVVAPLLTLEEIRGRHVAEIGSGTGRIANMLLEAGAAHVLAVEPSDAFEVLRENVARWGDRVSLLRATGEKVPPSGDLDLVFSVGVLHHIPDPEPVVAAACRALRPGGKMFAWVYGREGNGLYLALFGPVRALTRRLPHHGLTALVWALYPALLLYMALCRALPLPLHRYVREVLVRFAPAERRLVIYDQLNPAHARYYSRQEAARLLERAGFEDVRVYRRHGYSYSVIGSKRRSGPGDEPAGSPPDRGS